MNVDYVVIGSDTNPLYLDFWPVVSRVWKTVFNITPVLGLICSEDSDIQQDEYGLVKKLKAVSGVNTGLQSQIVRLFLPNILKGNILISDIDMLPLSKDYFVNSVRDFDENKFYVLSSDNAECVANLEYPMCYNLGHSDLYQKILNIPNNWNLFVEQISELNMGWSTDQRFLFDKIESFIKKEPNKICFKQRGWTPAGPAIGRIDRICWNYTPELIKEQHYIDCHMLRPYSTHKSEIDNLVQHIIES